MRIKRLFRDYVLLKPRRDILQKTTNLAMDMDDAAIERAKALSTNGEWNPTQFQIGASGKESDPNGFAFGEVLKIGPGNRALTECRPQLKVGDVVGYSRFRIAHEIGHNEDTKRQLVHEHGIVCRITGLPDNVWIEPCINWILTKRDPEGFRKALERLLPLTDVELDKGVSTNLHQRPDVHGGSKQAKPGMVVDSTVRMVIERVVGAGPGRWVAPLGLPVLKRPASTYTKPDGSEGWRPAEYEAKRLAPVFQPTECEGNELVALLRCGSSIQLYIRGTHYSLTPWGEFICAVDDGDEEQSAVAE